SGAYDANSLFQGELHNLRDGESRPLGQIETYGIAFSNDGRWLLTRRYDDLGSPIGSLWNLEQGGEPSEVGDVQSWQYSPDGVSWLAVTGYSPTGAYVSRLLDLTAGGVERDLGLGGAGEISGFSPDGRWALTRGAGVNGSYE